MEEIKQLSENDIDSVIKLSLDIFKPKEGKNEEHHLKSKWVENFGKQGLLLGTFLDGKLIAYTFSYKREGSKKLHYWMGGVKEEYRGRNIGRRLLEEQEKLAKKKGYESLTVNTYEEMYPIQFNLLKKYGYKIYKQEEHHLDGKIRTKSFFQKEL